MLFARLVKYNIAHIIWVKKSNIIRVKLLSTGFLRLHIYLIYAGKTMHSYLMERAQAEIQSNINRKKSGKSSSWRAFHLQEHLQLAKWLKQQTKFMKWSIIEKAYPGGAKFDIVRSDSKQIKINLQIVVTIKVTIVIQKCWYHFSWRSFVNSPSVRWWSWPIWRVYCFENLSTCHKNSLHKFSQNIFSYEYDF